VLKARGEEKDGKEVESEERPDPRAGSRCSRPAVVTLRPLCYRTI